MFKNKDKQCFIHHRGSCDNIWTQWRLPGSYAAGFFFFFRELASLSVIGFGGSGLRCVWVAFETDLRMRLYKFIAGRSSRSICAPTILCVDHITDLFITVHFTHLLLFNGLNKALP